MKLSWRAKRALACEPLAGIVAYYSIMFCLLINPEFTLDKGSIYLAIAIAEALFVFYGMCVFLNLGWMHLARRRILTSHFQATAHGAAVSRKESGKAPPEIILSTMTLSGFSFFASYLYSCVPDGGTDFYPVVSGAVILGSYPVNLLSNERQTICALNALDEGVIRIAPKIEVVVAKLNGSLVERSLREHR